MNIVNLNLKFKTVDIYHSIGWIFDDILKDNDTALLLYELQLEMYPDHTVTDATKYNIAHMLRFKEKERSISLFESIASRDLDAVWMLGTLLTNSDRDKAIEWFTNGKERGDIRCIHSLGDLYYYRYPNDLRDYKEAFNYYLESAEKGHTPSIQRVSFYYREGLIGLPKSEQLEAEWLEKIPPEKLSQVNKYNLGWYYLKRCYEVEKQAKGLKMMYELVDEYQDEDAMYNIGYAYQHGKADINKSVENVEIAKEWYIKGIQAQDYDCCIEMVKLTTGDEQTEYIKKGIRIRNDKNWKKRYHKEYTNKQKVTVEVGTLKSIIAELDEAVEQVKQYDMRPPLIGGRIFRDAMARFNRTVEKNDENDET